MLYSNLRWRGFRVYPWNIPQPLPGGYLILNLRNKKPYIGVSINLSLRLGAYSSSRRDRPINYAIRKYGASAFVIVPLFYLMAPPVKGELERIEADLIVFWNSVSPNGYNLLQASGGVGPYGPEFAKIISAAQKGVPHTPEALAICRAAAQDPTRRAKISAALTGRKMSPERVKQISESQKGRKHSDETKARMGMVRHPHTEEAKARMRASLRGRPAWNKGIPHSEDRRVSISVEQKAAWADPNKRTARVEKARATLLIRGRKKPVWTPEMRERARKKKKQK